MKSLADKLFAVALIAVLVFSVLCCAPDTVSAATTKPARVNPKKAITEFVSSVEFAEDSYEFDHDRDGVADMHVFPLLTTAPDLETRYITFEEAMKKKLVVLKEDVTNPALGRRDPPTSIVAQIGMSMG